jgi:quercetin dioxygenase-like cupin family protein
LGCKGPMGPSGERHMFNKREAEGYKETFPGILMKTLVHGERTLMVEFIMDAGSILPEHEHPHEQTGYLVSGAMRLVMGDEVHEVGDGDSWTIPGGVRHSAEVLEETIAVEVFSPRREEFID